MKPIFIIYMLFSTTFLYQFRVFAEVLIRSKEPWYVVQISRGPLSECTKDEKRELLENIIKDTKILDDERVKLKLVVKTKCHDFIDGNKVTCYPTPNSTAFYVWFNSKRECVENRKMLIDSGLF